MTVFQILFFYDITIYRCVIFAMAVTCDTHTHFRTQKWILNVLLNVHSVRVLRLSVLKLFGCCSFKDHNYRKIITLINYIFFFVGGYYLGKAATASRHK